MAVTVSGTSITFNDATVQTTAAVAPPTTFGAVGTYFIGFSYPGANSSTRYIPGDTVAGSNLRYATNDSGNSGYAYSLSGNLIGGGGTSSIGNAWGLGNYGVSAGLTGTWRAMAASKNGGQAAYDNYNFGLNLWVRVS